MDNEATVPTRALLPVLVSDSAADTGASADHSSATTLIDGGATRWEVVAPKDLSLSLTEPQVPSRNGWVKAAVADLPPETRVVRWKVSVS